MSLFESFRDPQGKVILDGSSEVWRLVKRETALQLEEFLGLSQVRQWQQEGKIIRTVPASRSEAETFFRKFEKATGGESFNLFKHPKISFPSFPYEWAPEMLAEAATLTLDLAEELLDQTNWNLKDASPFNILFEGTRPVFVDALSFEKREPHDPLWLPFNQFVQAFLIPLLVNRETGLPLSAVFMTSRDGLSGAEAGKFFRGLKKLKPEILWLITIPNFLSKRAEGSADLYKTKSFDSAEKARFALKLGFGRLRRFLEKVSPDRRRQSNWTEYTKLNQETMPEYMQAKQEFVAESIRQLRPGRVLDVGCNTGLFSFSAARSGAEVVAIDHDAAVVGEVYRKAKKENLNVLPMVVDLARPTPRLGWRYAENASFLDRALGHFDLVMMLAVVHHMLVQERIPLGEILRLASDLTKDALLVEFVPPADRMFQRLARGRDHLHGDLTVENFTRTAEEFFQIVRWRSLPPTDRRLFLMRKR